MVDPKTKSDGREIIMLRESLKECLDIVESVSDKRAFRAIKSRAHEALRFTEKWDGPHD